MLEAVPLGGLQAVDMVQDGDDANALLGKVLLQQTAQLRVIPAQAGVVLEDHAVDGSCLNVPHHAPVLRTLKIPPGISVVGVDRYGGNRLPLVPQVLDMLFNDPLLVLDAVALRFIPVLFAEADIDRYAPLDRGSTVLFSLILYKGHIPSFPPGPSAHLSRRGQCSSCFDRCAPSMEAMRDSRLGPLSA